ncbi:MAG: hypothetical protein WKF30_05450 [Pyrinomonadaceae bacterium]
MIRQLQRGGELPADLAALRENLSGAAPAPSPSTAGEMSTPSGTSTPSGAEIEKESGKSSGMIAAITAGRFASITPRIIYCPQRITAELQASRILRGLQ